MVAKGTCPDRSCIKQLRVHHARQQSSLGSPGSTNVVHKPSQVSSNTIQYSPFTRIRPQEQSSGTERISCPWLAKPLSFQEPFSGLCYPTNALPPKRLSLILNSRTPTSSAAHTTSASSTKPMTCYPWGAPHVISSCRDHLLPSYTTHLSLR